MKAIRVIFSELRTVICNPLYLVSVFTMTFFCFVGTVYIEDLTGKNIISFDLLINPELINQYKINYNSVLYNSIGTYVTIFLPALVSLPYVSTFITKWKSGYIRLSINRMHKKQFAIGSFIVSAISSGLVAVLGASIFAFVTGVYFGEQLNAESIILVLQFLAGVFLFAMIMGLFSLLLSSIVKNVYFACCLPCMLVYFYYSILTSCAKEFIEVGDFQNEMNVYKMYFSNLTFTFVYGNDNSAILLLSFIIAIIVFVLYFCLWITRKDFSE